LFRYLATNDLYDKTGIPEDELELYNPVMSKVWFSSYIEKEEKNLLNNHDKNLYNLYVDINTNGDNDKFYLFILNYAKVSKEIPDEILEKYIQKYNNHLDLIILVNGLITNSKIIPPDVLLKSIISTKEGRFATIRDLNKTLEYVEKYNTIVNREREHLLLATLSRVNELIGERDLKTESFKSFFYKKIK
jgi:H2-forming N5,N10-methylenetetrahydromethanopterin dehydrogenase-like enzyme